jgi:hypothetical protein
MIVIAQRVYRGLPDDPKTERGKRQAALPPDLAQDVNAWREISANTAPDALVFPSERGTYLSRDNFLRRNIQGKLEEIGLGWINFQVLRRTHASLGHKEGVDPKVAADQRGHAIGVAIDTYTESDLESRREAVTRLERALADRKPAEWEDEPESSAEPTFRGKTASEDEQIAYDVLTGTRGDTPKPDAVLLVLDSTNLARHLMLAAPILALGLPTLVVLNMADDLRKRGGALDLDVLEAQIGAPVALISARQGEGLDRIYEFLAGAMPKPTPPDAITGTLGYTQVPRMGRPHRQSG